MRLWTGLALTLLGVTACSGGCGGADDVVRPAPVEPGAPRADEPMRDTSETASSTSPPVDPAPAPELSVELLEGGALRIRNVGAHEVRVRGALRLERREGDAWVAQSSDFGLRTRCEDPVPECVTLVPGAELLPPRRLGTVDDARCACERCAAAEGELRFVVESCAPEGHVPHAIVSDAFRR